MEKGKILLIDDNPSVLRLNGEFLERAGYAVEMVSSGKQVLEFLEEKTFDLVLLDVNMPDMDGFEVCKKIRESYSLDELPVIFLTCREDFANVEAAFEAGASDYVSKMTPIEILLQRVNVHVQLVQAMKEIRIISLTDALTKCYNRRHAVLTLREWLARESRYGTSFAMVYLDMNGLKRINDGQGHLIGDALLCRFVEALKSVLRSSDMLFRMGGDEFMVLLPDTEKEGAVVCAHRMECAAKAMCPECGEYPFAFGTVHSSEKYSSADSMLLSADERMYHCKERMKRLGAASRD